MTEGIFDSRGKIRADLPTVQTDDPRFIKVQKAYTAAMKAEAAEATLRKQLAEAVQCIKTPVRHIIKVTRR